MGCSGISGRSRNGDPLFSRRDGHAQAPPAGRFGEAKLDGALLFAHESDYWLTGYDTFGFCFFQCLYVGADGRMALLTRSADLRQAQRTSDITDIRVWRDGADAEPAHDLAAMLDDLGAGRRLGVEFNTAGLPHYHGRKLEAALAARHELVDISDLVPRLRVRKLAGRTRLRARGGAALRPRRPRRPRGYPRRRRRGRNPGRNASCDLRKRRRLSRQRVHHRLRRRRAAVPLQERAAPAPRPTTRSTLEFAGVSRHYHAAIMRTHVVGRPKPLHAAYHAAAREALDACAAALRLGRTAGDVFAAHARVFDAHGLAPHRLNACGYALGARFTPSWMDAPMFYAATRIPIDPDEVYFLHMILMDSDTETALCLGRTYVTTPTAPPQPINAADLDLQRK